MRDLVGVGFTKLPTPDCQGMLPINERGGDAMRTILSWLLILVAAFFAFVGVAMPLTLPRQATNDRAYFQQFRQAAAYVDANGHLPTEATLRRLNVYLDGATIWSSLAMTPEGCDPPFAKATSDRFVIGFWRGEWFECYAHPSGKTTLPMSVMAYLSAGLGFDLAVYWMLAIAASLGAIRLRKARPIAASNRS
jgi:hypothetical protein